MYKTITIILTFAATSVFAENTINVPATNPVVQPSKLEAQTAIHGISPQAAADSVRKMHAIIIDVRESSEIARASIPGAINIPLNQLKNRLVELDKYKQSPIITQCRTGRRSQEAMKTLLSSGFTDVQNLEGGIIAWEKAGLKTEKKCC